MSRPRRPLTGESVGNRLEGWRKSEVMVSSFFLSLSRTGRWVSVCGLGVQVGLPGVTNVLWTTFLRYLSYFRNHGGSQCSVGLRGSCQNLPVPPYFDSRPLWDRVGPGRSGVDKYEIPWTPGPKWGSVG